MAPKLATADYVVLAVYLVGTLALGLWIGRRVKTGSDFFLAGRRLPWWAVGMSLVATDIGGTDIIGVGGAAYVHGLAVGNFEWIGCVPAMIVAAFVFIPYFWRLGIYTIPEFMERRYNAAVRTALALCWLAFMACNLGIMLLASAKMMTVLFDGSEFHRLFGTLFGSNVSACIWITAALVGIYTCAGGLAAVVYTDVVQCAVMIAGCLLVLCLGLWEVGGVGELRARIHAVEQERRAAASQDPANESAQVEPGRRLEHTALVLPVDTKSPFPWTGIFFGLALVLSPAYWIGNQAIVQRSLGAKSEFEAKAAYVWGAVLKNLIPFLIAVPGLIALVKFPDLQDGDQAFPQLAAALLPAGLRGVFLAAFLAALMSSVDSYLNSAATILSNDLYKRFLSPQASERHLLWVGRVTTLALVAWAIFFAFQLTAMKEGIYAIFQTLMAFFQGPALAILLTGLFWRRATGTAALVAFVVGVLFSMTLFALSQPAVTARLGWEPLFQISEPFLYFSVWAFLVSLVLIVAVSFCTRPEPDAQVRPLLR
jgi:SSS family solute:Na+ symporter